MHKKYLYKIHMRVDFKKILYIRHTGLDQKRKTVLGGRDLTTEPSSIYITWKDCVTLKKLWIPKLSHVFFIGTVNSFGDSK